MFERIKDFMVGIVKSRLFVLIIIFSIASMILMNRAFYLQIVKGQDYLDNYKLKIRKTRTVQGTRGKILDRNGEVLADNELAFAVTIEDNGSYETTADKNKALNQTANKIIEIVEGNKDSIISDFGVILDATGEYQYVSDGTQKLRFLADVFGYTTIDKLSEKQKNYTAAELINYLCTDKTNGYGINQKKYEKERVLKIVNIRYALGLNKFQKYIATTVATGVSNKTAADIMENLDVLQGVNVEETALRRYTDSKYFANLIGYTGKISQEEFDSMSTGDKSYSLQDVIGKAGLEQTQDKILQGKKGKEVVYVDSLGKVIETAKGKDASAGDNLYLTIDKNLQEAAYNIVEEKLAAILLTKLQNTLDYTPDPNGDSDNIIIPISEVYNSFISNEILNSSHFSSPDAQPAEQAVHATYAAGQERALTEVISQLQSPEVAAYKDLPTELQAYMNYIAAEVLTKNTGILLSDAIDTNDSTYQAWKEEESISLYTFLNYAISKNWVDTSKLKQYVAEGKYSDSNEVYQGILTFLAEELKTDKGFEKLVYRYMIRAGTISGAQLCMILYEQNVLPFDEAQYNSLAAGGSAFDFVRNKIQTLELTPGQLALEPCTASMVVTDPNTGEVLAMVSYPGYDSNRLANNMDASYYNQLVKNGARPLFNTATQEKTAPGSTYKMVSSIAGLTESVISPDTYLECNGLYDKVTPNPKCWIYPGAHGGLNVVGALENSCNCFYYEVGYRLSLAAVQAGETAETNGNKPEQFYSSDQGIEFLRKYSALLGLGEKSGVEIPESSPEISDNSSVPSAIGQGTHNYTGSQLARYVSTIANGGTLYDLTLLSKTEDLDGNMIQKFEPKVNSKSSEISPSSYALVQQGMRNMVASSRTFSVLGSEGMEMSGKTGTAQQSKIHANHALFVGYAPSDSPQIAISCRIANGYSSNYTSEIARDVVRYYFDLTDKTALITGHAAELGSASHQTD
ncbi:MAG: penicillin-binding transpeptidase domain-containing protein [Lachnospiraceae bacterium]